jgi:hypothetical protein
VENERDSEFTSEFTHLYVVPDICLKSFLSFTPGLSTLSVAREITGNGFYGNQILDPPTLFRELPFSFAPKFNMRRRRTTEHEKLIFEKA